MNIPDPPYTADRAVRPRHLRPHATFGDDPSGWCGCAGCEPSEVCGCSSCRATFSATEDQPFDECDHTEVASIEPGQMWRNGTMTVVERCACGEIVRSYTDGVL